MTNESILVVPSQTEEHVSGGKFLGKGAARAVKMDVNVLRTNLNDVLAMVPSIVPDQLSSGSPYELDEIELTVEVYAEGRVQLVGGIAAGATGGLTVRLRRRPPG